MHLGMASPRRLVVATVLTFAAFGTFWGVWGASIPRVRDQAGVDDARLGVALLFVGAGAVPAMLLTGRAIDRWGLRVAAVTVGGLAVSGVVVAVASQDLVSLAAALTLVGITSGGTDVAMNTMAGRAERRTGRPVITRAHAVFSAFVVIASLGTGLLAWRDAPILAGFLPVAMVALVATLTIWRLPGTGVAGTSAASGRSAAEQPHPPEGSGPPAPAPAMVSLLGLGLLGALAFAGENAHQSWGAIFLTDALGTDTALASLAPAVFAAAVATTRFAVGGVGVSRARTLLGAGSATAAAGAVLLSVAPNLAVGLVGLVIAAAGTAVLFPTVLGVVSARVAETHRGRSTSIVTTVAYLGFLLGPVYVGLWSGAFGVRGAMLAVAALAAVLLLVVLLVAPATIRPVSPGPVPDAVGVARPPTGGGRVSTPPPEARPAGRYPGRGHGPSMEP